jgi:hypothetical protein
MRSHALVMTTFLLLTAFSRGAAAEEVSPAPPPRRVWYGWQTLVVDGAAIGTMGLAFAVKDQNASAGSSLAYLSMATCALGPPLVNVAHGNTRGALRSVAVRVGAPLVAGFVLGAIGGGIGFAVASPFRCKQIFALNDNAPEVSCSAYGAVGGFALGAFAGGLAGYGAAVISDAALAYDAPAVEKEKAPATRPQGTWSIAPKVALSPKGGVQLGVGGAF